MSKSKGNFYTLRDLIDNGFHPMAVRFFVVSSHYRTPVNLTMDGLKAAHASWSRIMDFHGRLKELLAGETDGEKSETLAEELIKCVERFKEHMDDDLDTPRAVRISRLCLILYAKPTR